MLLVNVYPPKEHNFDELCFWDEGSELSPVMFAWSAIGDHSPIAFCFLQVTAGQPVHRKTLNKFCEAYQKVKSKN